MGTADEKRGWATSSEVPNITSPYPGLHRPDIQQALTGLLSKPAAAWTELLE